MPSEWSASGPTPCSTAFGPASLGMSASVIALALLPFSSLQAEPGDQDGAEQERNHRSRNRGAFAEVTSQNGTLIGQRRHQLRSIDRAAAREHPDQLEIGEGEQNREGHD